GHDERSWPPRAVWPTSPARRPDCPLHAACGEKALSRDEPALDVNSQSALPFRGSRQVHAHMAVIRRETRREFLVMLASRLFSERARLSLSIRYYPHFGERRTIGLL